MLPHHSLGKCHLLTRDVSQLGMVLVCHCTNKRLDQGCDRIGIKEQQATKGQSLDKKQTFLSTSKVSTAGGGQTAEGSMNTKSRHSSALCNRCGRDQLRRNCTNKHLCTLASACPEQTRARPQLRCWSCDFNSPALRVSRVSRTAVWPSCTFPTPHGQRC